MPPTADLRGRGRWRGRWCIFCDASLERQAGRRAARRSAVGHAGDRRDDRRIYGYDKTKGVLVGIIDTGVDGSHPDIAPNFDAELSRNFTVDIEVDAKAHRSTGPVQAEPDQSCEDAADVDENGHGTHVASTIGSPINGVGIAGVAPDTTLVNLRAGQDSGYFFLQASVDALTYAGDNGIDVVNMSYYVDPWLFNCVDPRTDTRLPTCSSSRRSSRAMQRALDYARGNGVTLVSAAGNGATDYTKVISDRSSPDFASVPGEVAYTRDLLDPASCISMPSEGDGVISVSSTGQSDRKSYYSDYGNGYVDVAAPGGDVYDNAEGTRQYPGGILAAYPAALAERRGRDRRERRRGRAMGGRELRRDGRDLRVLPVPAGHLDGLAARCRRRGADRRRVRQARPDARRKDPVARHRRVDAALDCRRHGVPGARWRSPTCGTCRAARPRRRRTPARGSRRRTASTVTAS